MHLEIVVDESGPNVLRKVCARVAIADGAGLRKAEQEIGEVVSRIGHRALSARRTGSETGEIESSASIRIGPGVQVAAPILDAERERVPPSDENDVLAEGLALIARQACVPVAKRSEISKVEIGRAEINGI